MEKHATGRNTTGRRTATVIFWFLCLVAASLIFVTGVPGDRGVATVRVTETTESQPNNMEEAEKPTITYLGPATSEDRATVDWAVGRFEANGLRLPSLSIEFPATCGGKSARYFVSAAHIELCDASRLVVLHELAHAWDDAARLVDRDDFMDRRGTDHWFAQEGRLPSESGGEQLAKIMAWGLMDQDTSTPIFEVADGELLEIGREIRGIGRGETEVIASDFEWLVGFGPLHLATRVDAERT